MLPKSDQKRHGGHTSVETRNERGSSCDRASVQQLPSSEATARSTSIKMKPTTRKSRGTSKRLSKMTSKPRKVSEVAVTDETTSSFQQIEPVSTPPRENKADDDEVSSERRSSRKRKINPRVEAFLKGKDVKHESVSKEPESCIEKEVGDEVKRRKTGHENRGPVSTLKSIEKNTKVAGEHDNNAVRTKDPEEKGTASENANNVDEIFVGGVIIEEVLQQRDPSEQQHPQKVPSDSEDEVNKRNRIETQVGPARTVSGAEESTQREPERDEGAAEIPAVEIVNVPTGDGDMTFKVVFDEQSDSYHLTMSSDSIDTPQNQDRLSEETAPKTMIAALNDDKDQRLRNDSRTVFVCPVCKKAFVSQTKFTKHVVGTSCTNIMLQEEVEIPEELSLLLEKAKHVGDSKQCPACERQLCSVEVT